MALKLGKCRLCLKLGDFYSIFTVDNSVQLAEMVMECSKVKVYEGDGLPDKVCAECIQKLSSAYIFKQQCERADQELRRNYVPPPGFCITPPPNRQSSDSAFSNHTDLSNQTKPSSSTENKVTPANRSRKRSRESTDNASVASRSQDNSLRASGSKQRAPVTKKTEKRPRLEPENVSAGESDYEDNSASHFSADYSDSDEPLINQNQFSCDLCGKTYEKKMSLLVHKQWHSRPRKGDIPTPKKQMGENAVVEIPKTSNENSKDDEDKLSCEKCGKNFKLKIMLKRHADSCLKIAPQISPKKELLIALEPISPIKNSSPHQDMRISCEMCPTKFKTVDNLEKHMRVCHAAVLKKKDSLKLTIAKNDSQKVPVPCIFCSKPFDDYYQHAAHYNACPLKTSLIRFECTVCQKNLNRKDAYFTHIKNFHFEPRCVQLSSPDKEGASSSNFQCRICSKKLATQERLITHLAAHVSNIDDGGSVGDEESRASTVDDDASMQSDYSANASSGPLKCKYCDKQFTYRKALQSHEIKHTTGEIEIKIEPPDPDVSTTYEETSTPTPKAVAIPKQASALKERKIIYRDTESDDSSQDDGDNTCDICEKMFSYKRLLIQHKRTKHNMSSGTKRANILLKDCKVKCLICDLEMKVSNYKEHNQTHIANNLKPRNLYTCIDCEDTFKSCQSLATHIKLVHRLNKQVSRKVAIPDLADFCEVVVTKTEPLDEIQSHNGFGEVPASGDATKPLVDLSGFTCPICSKKMQTLISLKRHVNWHTNVGNNIEKKIECFVCKEQFRFKGHYRLHMREHYTDPNLDPKFLICSICNRKSKHLRAAQAHMNFHKQTRFKAQDYQCSICKRIFQDRKVYLSHMAIHYKRGDTIQNTVVGDITPQNKPAQTSNDANTCPYCNKVCETEVSLKHHMSWHKSKTALYGGRHECPFCHLQFTNKRRQELHLRTHFEDDNGPYKCNICGKGYNDEEYFRRHVKGHNFDHQSHKKRIAKLRENKVKCPICTRYYPDVVKLIRHLRRTHPQSKMIKADPDAPPQQVYSCKLCAKVFLDERRLQFHEEAHLRKPEFFKCKFCGKKTISLKNHNVHIKAHLVRKHIDDPLKCYKCDEHFIRGYDLHYHLRDVHNIKETWIAERGTQTLNGPLKELQCSICLKVLASQGNFERHIDYHNTLRCNYCYDYFSSLRFLEGHLAFSCEKKKLIGDTEPYPRKIKCQVCYKAFHLQVKLDCHLRTQHDIKVSREVMEGKKEIVCDYCFRVFENEYALSTHKIYHRTIGYYGCLYCDRKFNTLTVYRKHKNHHFSQLNVDNPTKCEHCDETFVAFREFIYHMKDAHGDDKEWIVEPKESIEEKCNICGKIFFNLHKHLTYHEENRCKKCKEYFFSMADFDNHLCSIESDDEHDYNDTEEGPEYEECVFCFKGLTKTNSKLKHDLIHRGSGAISCRFCLLKFKTMDAFNIHAFSHRSRKYNKKPIKCRKCNEKFVKYGPFMKHMKVVHKSKEKMHYRAIVKPERCVVCGEDFPNLHNHYRAHLQNRCEKCGKYFTSVRVFNLHQCDKEDLDPTKVFVSDENLLHLINTYVPKDLKDGEKYYGMSDDEEDEQVDEVKDEKDDITIDTASQNSQDSAEVEHLVPLSIQSPIISDVLSLYQERPHELLNMGQKGNADGDCVIDLSDEDDVDIQTTCHPTVTIDD